MTAADLDTRDLLHSLRSKLCPLCSGKKGSMKTVCFGCWRAVPKRIRDRLYDGVHAGYEQACAEMFNLFGVSPASLGLRLRGHCANCEGTGVIERPGGVKTSCPDCEGKGIEDAN